MFVRHLLRKRYEIFYYILYVLCSALLLEKKIIKRVISCVVKYFIVRYFTHLLSIKEETTFLKDRLNTHIECLLKYFTTIEPHILYLYKPTDPFIKSEICLDTFCIRYFLYFSLLLVHIVNIIVARSLIIIVI